MSERPSEAPRAPSAPDVQRPLGLAVLQLVAPLAVAAILAVLLGRAIGPSIAGIGVGLDRIIPAIEYGGGLATQLCGILAIVLSLAELLTLRRSRISPLIRNTCLVLGAVVIAGCFFASSRTEGLSLVARATVGVSASLLAMIAAKGAWRAPFVRGAALVVGLVGLASLVRVAAVALAYRSSAPGWARWVSPARGISTVAFVLGALAVAAATVWLASSAKKPTNPLTLGLLMVALFLTRQALVGEHDDAGAGSLLLRRALGRLLTTPASFVPHAVQLFVAALAPVVAIASLLPRAVPLREGADPSAPRARMPSSLGASIALALIVRDTPEMPLAAVFLAIAGISVALSADDDRGVWSAISATSR